MIKINFQGFALETETTEEAVLLVRKLNSKGEITQEKVGVQIIRNKSKKIRGQKNHWEALEIAFIENNPELSPKEISKHLGIGSRHTIAAISCQKWKINKEKQLTRAPFFHDVLNEGPKI